MQLTGTNWQQKWLILSIILLAAGLSISVSLITFFQYSLFIAFIVYSIRLKSSFPFRKITFILPAIYTFFVILSCFTSTIFLSSTRHLLEFFENYFIFLVFYTLSADRQIEGKLLFRILMTVAGFFVLQMSYIIFAHFTRINVVSLNGWIRISPSDYFGRQSGTFDFPAFVSALFCLIIPLFYYLWKKADWKKGIKIPLFLISVLICFWGLYYTHSTGAMAAFAAGMLFYVVIKILRQLGLLKGSIVSAGIIIVLLIGAVLSFSRLPEKAKRGLIYRYEMARGSYDLGYYRPLLGSGPNTFHNQYRELVKKYPEKYSYFSERWFHAHNTLMNTLAESGFPAALALFAFFVILIFQTAKRFYLENHLESGVFSVMLVMILVYSLSDDVFNIKPAAVLLWMIIGIFTPLCFRPSSQEKSG